MLVLLIFAFYSAVSIFGPFGPPRARFRFAFDVTDVSCMAGQPNGYHVSIKNLDTGLPINISAMLSARIDGNISSLIDCNFPSIPPSGTANCSINATGGPAGFFHSIRIIGPASSAEIPAKC